MSTDRFKEVTVQTTEQVYILSEIHETHASICRLLEKVERNAREAIDRDYFDTPFLLNPCAEVGFAVAEYRALRRAAHWAGCTREQIAEVCVYPQHVIVEEVAS